MRWRLDRKGEGEKERESAESMIKLALCRLLDCNVTRVQFCVWTKTKTDITHGYSLSKHSLAHKEAD